MKKVWFFTCSLVILLCQAGIAQIDGNDLAYQGQLFGTDNLPVPDNTYTFTYFIWDNCVGGTPLWQETQNVEVVDGLFNVNLGSVNPIPDSALSVNLDDSLYLIEHIGYSPQ